MTQQHLADGRAPQVVTAPHAYGGQSRVRHQIPRFDERESVDAVLVDGGVHLPDLRLDLAERGLGQLPVQRDGPQQTVRAGVVHLRALSAHREPPAAEDVEQRPHPRGRPPRHHQVPGAERRHLRKRGERPVGERVVAPEQGAVQISGDE
jgi:hypothetical protein